MSVSVCEKTPAGLWSRYDKAAFEKVILIRCGLMGVMMSSSEVKIEWLFINLRWFFLLAVVSVIGLDVVLRGSTFPSSVVLLLIFGSLANLIAVVALLQSATGTLLQRLMLLNDIALTLGFIASSAGIQSQLIFMSLIPITVAAMRVSWFASILLTGAVVVVYIFMASFSSGISLTSGAFGQILPLLTESLILVIAGTAVSYIGVRIKQSLLAERLQQEEQARQAIQAAQKRARLIFELSSTLSATLNYELILQAALDVSDSGLRELFRDAEDAEQVGMILLFGMDQALYIAASRGLPDTDADVTFAAQQGILSQAVNQANPIIISNPEDDPELGFLQGIKECQQAIIIPLRAGFESFGFLVMASLEADVYTEALTELLVAICNQAVLALQNASLYQNLMDDKNRLITIEEDARKHLARNLHDGPTQTIAAIAMRLNYIRNLMKTDPNRASAELADVEAMARLTTKEIRQMLFTLRPLILESQGLIAAVEQLRQKLAEINNLKVHLEADPGVDTVLSHEAKGSLFYIIDEAVTNAKKHALAKNVWIRIFKQGSNIITEIEDDGIGFDVTEWERNYADRGNMGLFNVRERAELVRGRTVVRSTPGEGTLITVTIPTRDMQDVQ